MCKSILSFCRREPVLILSCLCALVSCLFVPPSLDYLSYIDVRVLCILFCLMAVVSGLQECGLFLVLAQKLLIGERPLRILTVILTMLPFFSSMLVTNDVALITFVPFAILVLGMVGRQDLLIPVIVLQTIAANLGSMTTPVGNPQNLFLYAHYDLTIGAFLSVLLPLTILSLVLLIVASLFVGGKGWISVSFPEQATIQSHKHLLIYLVLFLLCLLSVSHILSHWVLTVLVIVALFVCNRKLLLEVDYFLLCTFVCFFIFSGNLGNIPVVVQTLSQFLERSTLLSSAVASQVISNVPAAVLLAGLTDHWQELLTGVNVGGLGTPVASLASLISLKFYLRTPDSRTSSYLLWFGIANLIGLCILLPLSLFLLP